MSTWSSDEMGAFLESLGFHLARREGHDTYAKAGHPRIASVPRNERSIAKGTVGHILRQAGTTASASRAWKEGSR